MRDKTLRLLALGLAPGCTSPTQVLAAVAVAQAEAARLLTPEGEE